MSAGYTTLTFTRPYGALVVAKSRIGLNRFDLMAWARCGGESVAFAAGGIEECHLANDLLSVGAVLWIGRTQFRVSLDEAERIAGELRVRDDVSYGKHAVKAAA